MNNKHGKSNNIMQISDTEGQRDKGGEVLTQIHRYIQVYVVFKIPPCNATVWLLADEWSSSYVNSTQLDTDSYKKKCTLGNGLF